MTTVERHDGIAIVRLAHGKANALDLEFCVGLARQLDALAGDDARAAVVTADGAIFSAGVDLKRLLDGGADYLGAFLPALHDLCVALFAFPKPLVAAVNGHAIAGGCIITGAADRRLMARGGAHRGPRARAPATLAAVRAYAERTLRKPGRRPRGGLSRK